MAPIKTPRAAGGTPMKPAAPPKTSPTYPSSGTLHHRIMKPTQVLAATRLTTARGALLSCTPSYPRNLKPSQRAKYAAAHEALDGQTDSSNRLHAYLSTPEAKFNSRAVMAPRDVARIRKMRKAVLRERIYIRDEPMDWYMIEHQSMVKEYWTSANRDVWSKDPLVGWEDVGKRWTMRGRTLGTKWIIQGRWAVNKLRTCVESVGGEEEGGRAAKTREEKEHKMCEMEKRFWGGYVKVGRGVVEDADWDDIYDDMDD